MACIGEVLDQQVALRGAATAICDKDDTVSYRDLGKWTAKIAASVVSALGKEPKPCAVIGYNEVTGIAAVLGVLRTPHVLVTIDADTPSTAVARILADLNVEAVLLTNAARDLVIPVHLRHRMEIIRVEPHRWDEGIPEWKEAVPSSGICAIKLTSGTTGNRKCVEISQGAELKCALRGAQVSGIDVGAVLASCATIDTTAGRSSMLRTLLGGGTYLPCDLRHEPIPAIGARLSRSHITHFHGPTTAFRLLASELPRHSFESLTCVHLAGEPVSTAEAELISAVASRECRLNTAYGATEVGLAAISSSSVGEILDRGELPPLRAVESVSIEVVDETGQKRPSGASGLISISGPFVANGYRGVEQGGPSVEFPKSANGDRTFVTEDRGRLDGSGQLVLEGRTGSEVKIRGRRVDLMDLEAWFTERADVRLAAVVVRQGDRDTDRHLAAFLATDRNWEDIQEDLRHALQADLPSHMHPKFIICRETLPLTASGKLDRRRLAKETAAPNAHPTANRVSQEYRALGEIWERVLGRQVTSKDGSFFDLGGDSLSAAQLSLAIEARLGQRVDLAFPYRFPTLREQQLALGDLFDDPKTRDPLIAPLIEHAPPNAARCFVISGVNGHVVPFVPVAQGLCSSGWDMMGVLHPSLRLEEPTCGSIEALADRMLYAIGSERREETLFLIGYSLGGLIAHEIACRLEERGEMTGVVVIDTQPKALLPAAQKLHRAARSRWHGLRDLAWRQTGSAQRQARAAVTKLHDMSLGYVPPKRAGPMALICSQASAAKAPKDDFGWRKVAPNFERYMVQGDHLSLFKGQNLAPFVTCLASALDGLTRSMSEQGQ